MSKSRKPEPEAPAPKPEGVFLRLDHARVAALQAFIAAQKVPPKRASVILQAIDEFLRREGFAPKTA